MNLTAAGYVSSVWGHLYGTVCSQYFGSNVPISPAAPYQSILSCRSCALLHHTRQALFDATRQRHADRLASVADRQKAAADVAQQQQQQ